MACGKIDPSRSTWPARIVRRTPQVSWPSRKAGRVENVRTCRVYFLILLGPLGGDDRPMARPPRSGSMAWEFRPPGRLPQAV